MLGDSPQVFGSGVGSMIERHGSNFPYQCVADELKAHDITLANLEIPVSGYDSKSTPFEKKIYRTQPHAIDGLAAAGVDIVSACTNHMMQHGLPGLKETLDTLNKAGISVIGIEMPERNTVNRLVVKRKSMRFALLGYNFRPQQYFVAPPQWKEPSLELMKSEVAAVRDETDVVIVTLHWGDEFIEFPAPDQVKLARELIDSGVNIVIGHHTHIVQGVEKYNGGVIAYSLGNFVYDQWQRQLRRSMILKLNVRRPDDIDFEIIPVMINKYHQPQIVTGDEGDALKHEIAALADRIGTVDSETYRAELDRNYRKFRREVYTHYLTHAFTYKPGDLLANLLGAIRRRV